MKMHDLQRTVLTAGCHCHVGKVLGRVIVQRRVAGGVRKVHLRRTRPCKVGLASACAKAPTDYETKYQQPHHQINKSERLFHIAWRQRVIDARIESFDLRYLILLVVDGGRRRTVHRHRLISTTWRKGKVWGTRHTKQQRARYC